MKFTILILAIVTITFSVLRDSFIISDEAVNLQMVKNMKYSKEFIDRPSYNPGGELNWKRDSVRIIQMTPVFHYIYLFANKVLPGNLIQTSSIVQSFYFLMLVVLIFFILGDPGKLKSNNLDFSNFISKCKKKHRLC